MGAANSLSDLQLIWESLKEQIKESGDITETAFNFWFANVKLVTLDSEKAVFSVENDLKMDIIAKKFSVLLSDHFEKMIGYAPDVEFILNVEDAPFVARSTSFFRYATDKNGKTVVISPPSDEDDVEEDEDDGDEDEKPFFEAGGTSEKKLCYNPDYTFENFIVGKSNEYAHAAAQAVAKNPAGAYNPLLLYGPSGVGKTHLMYAITNNILERRPDCNIVYVKGEEFTNQLIESISTKSTQLFREKYRKADVLLVDDVQFIAGKTATQEEFFHTFNALHEDHKQIILTSDRPPRDMETLEERIKSRFESGLIIDINPPDFELRLAILRNKAEQVNLDVSIDILNYLAENLYDNVRKIEGVIKKLSAVSFISGAPITLEMAKAQVEAYRPQKETPQETANRIFIAAAKRYNVTVEDILDMKRTKEIKTARNVSMFIIKKMTSLSLSEIGKLTNRDHATVHSNISAVINEMKNNAYFETEINDIISEIKNG